MGCSAENMLQCFPHKLLHAKISLKTHSWILTLITAKNCDNYNEEEDERFHHNIQFVEQSCQGRRDISMPSHYFGVLHEIFLPHHSQKQSFETPLHRCLNFYCCCCVFNLLLVTVTFYCYYQQCSKCFIDVSSIST